MNYKYVKCRLVSKLRRYLYEYSKNGYRLKSVVMADLMTRFDLVFEKLNDPTIKYEYVHEKCRLSSKVSKYLNEYSAQGFKLVFHVMSDLGTRHELFFERQKK